jgi:hypothetical protein
MDRFFTLTEPAFCVTCPFLFGHVVLGSNGIMPNQPQPDFDFYRNFCLSQMAKRPVYAVVA